MIRASVSIEGEEKAEKYLGRYRRPEIDHRLDRGVLRGARALRPFIRAAAPRGPGRRHPLASSVRARMDRREAHSALVGPTSRLAVISIRGSREHEIAPRLAKALRLPGGRFAAHVHVSGVHPNPWPQRGVVGHEEQAAQAVAEEFDP